MKKKNVLTPNKGILLEKLPAYFLFGLILLVCIFLYKVVEPFFMVLIFSAVVAAVTYPIYEVLSNWLKGRNRLAAFLTCTIVVFAIVLPITAFVLVLIAQVSEGYFMIRDYLIALDYQELFSWRPGSFFYDLLGIYSQDVENFVISNLQSLTQGITEATKEISSFAAEQSLNLFKSVGWTIFNVAVMFFVLYFYYKDGKNIIAKIMNISPLPLKQEKLILIKFREISKATLIGTFLTAISQGAVAWIGFMIAGIPAAFFWATAVSVFSLVPIVGTGIVWVPMGFYLLLTGDFFWAIFIFLWGALLIGTIDNFLRVIFIGGSAKLNPLLTFLAVFGGLMAFGLLGVVLGPLLLVMFITLIDIYETEYASVLSVELDHENIDEVIDDVKEATSRKALNRSDT
ncbi:AI-2E family transporter [Candidatus Peregrinibacteria bacterium]|nr:AI-2E family transporter [Candidatus Peregrinibacteria bacterium]